MLHADRIMWKDFVDDRLTREFFQYMVEQEVPFEYAGLSYPYAVPDWVPGEYTREQFFGRMSDLVDYVSSLHKKVILAEVAYNWYLYELGIASMPDYPFTPARQATWVRDQLQFTSNHPDIAGFFYWYPDWFPGFADQPAQVQSLGLFSNDSTPLPAMAEFKVNLS